MVIETRRKIFFQCLYLDKTLCVGDFNRKNKNILNRMREKNTNNTNRGELTHTLRTKVQPSPSVFLKINGFKNTGQSLLYKESHRYLLSVMVS